MIHIAICDDTPQQLKLIQIAAERFFATRMGCEHKVSTFLSAEALLDYLNQSGGCDIALLDICMPGMLGTEAAAEMRSHHHRTEIIFLTTSDEYAVEAFALKAAHYLIKPFTQTQFDEAMKRALSHLADGAPKTISIRAESGEIYTIDIADILYIESLKHSLSVHLKAQTIIEFRRSLARLLEELEKLSPGQFVSPYKGYIVNHRAIRSIEKDKIVLNDQSVVPIPKRGYRAVQDAYFDYLFAEKGGKQ